MAKFEYKMPEDFLLKISKLAENTDVIVPKVLKAGAEVVYEKVKNNLQSVVGKNTKSKSRASGELVSALGITSVKQDKNGDFNIKIGFNELRSDGGSNAKIANILEYGKRGQNAKPFLKPAKSQSKGACVEAMKNTLESEIERL